MSKSADKYKAMSKQERRVAIAKDVIAAIHAKAFMAIKTGAYVFTDKDYELLDQQTAKEIMPACSVCARGAMLMCRIAKYNHAEVIGYVTQSDTRDALADAFTPAQLDLIEAAFERRDCRGADWGTTETLRRRFESAFDFGRDHSESEDRLLAIMQNIVDHDGEFKPKVRYVVK